MKDGFLCQRRFVRHQKKIDFRIIVVCMKYKCQRGLVFQGCCMKILDYWGLCCYTIIDNCCEGYSCCCGHESCGDDGCDWGIRSVTT